MGIMGGAGEPCKAGRPAPHPALDGPSAGLLNIPGMPHGFNRTVEHEGRKLHVQIEDLSPRQAVFDVRVYEGGQVLFHKKVNHVPTDPDEHESTRAERLRAAAEKLLV